MTKDDTNKVEFSSKEFALILALRGKFRYGEIVVIMHQGVPVRLKQVQIFDDLDLKKTQESLDS